MTEATKSKFYRVTAERAAEYEALAAEIMDERGGTLSVTSLIDEAMKFYKENRPKSGVL